MLKQSRAILGREESRTSVAISNTRQFRGNPGFYVFLGRGIRVTAVCVQIRSRVSFQLMTVHPNFVKDPGAIERRSRFVYHRLYSDC
jgi:hypothetical protein